MKSISKIGIAIIVATLGSFSIATLERKEAVEREDERLNAEDAARPVFDKDEAERRAQWKVARFQSGQDQWKKAIDSGNSAQADKYTERADAEIKEQEKTWADEDEKKRAERNNSSKERHNRALATIERNFYVHFVFAWLVIAGVWLAIGGFISKRKPPTISDAPG